ncbi:MAG: hypothetical protein KGN37_09595 [Burkholderiales bacterium]|nr:hypothetical protein [Burkholderiales bacterium]
MFFDTPIYFVFLTLVVLGYWRLGHRGQNWLLLVFSYIFYGWWDWRFLGLMALSTVIDFICAQWIADSSEARNKKVALAGCGNTQSPSPRPSGVMRYQRSTSTI